MALKPRTIDEYLAGLSPENRAALQKLRRAVLAAAPGAEECISYGMPAFRLKREAHCRLQGGREPLFFSPHERRHSGNTQG